MSRSVRGAKPPSFEYWGTRGWPRARMAAPGAGVKAATHRAERRTCRQHCEAGLEEVCTDADGIGVGPPLRSGGRRQPLAGPRA